MLRIGWLENPDNIVYADLEEFADNFGNEVGISNLKQEIAGILKIPPGTVGTRLARARKELRKYLEEEVSV